MKHRLAAGVAGFLLSFLAACSSGGPTVTASPARSVEDESLAIVVRGLAAHERVALTLRSTDADGVAFSARDTYRADGAGTVDLARTAPLPGGSYTGVWGMGLLTSMGPPQGVAPARSLYSWLAEQHRFVVRVTAGGRTLASTSFERRLRIGRFRDVSLSVARDGIDGRFSAPRSGRRLPAVLFLGGSEGGDPGSYFPKLLAAHGLPTLAVGYFHAQGLPDRLVNIPLEYFRRALDWLRRQPEVDPSRISVVGVSYGSEAALLLGVHYPRLVYRVAAMVPSSVVTCGILGAGRIPARGPTCLGSPWSIGGRPLPHTALVNQPHPWDDPRAVIPVERIREPVFLVCAGGDEEWSSCPYAHAIVARRRAHGERSFPHRYADAGHGVGVPVVYEPGTLASLVFPRTEVDRERYYPSLLAFLGARIRGAR